MGRILPFTGDPHRDTRDLLPWYVTDRLDEDERARAEAHLLTCHECGRDLAAEQALAANVAALPMETEIGWAAMRARLEAAAPPAWPLGARSAAPFRTRQVGWFLAAQAALLVAAVSIGLYPLTPPARYHALGSAPASPGGNLIVIFRPDSREQDMRRALGASGARLVDGPTAANAYVLHVPEAQRAAALTKLRSDAAIVLAEPIDAAALQ